MIEFQWRAQQQPLSPIGLNECHFIVPRVRQGLRAHLTNGKGAASTAEKNNPTAKLGWRFTAGVVLIMGGYVAWSLIPVVVTADLPGWAKSGLAALLGATPFMSKVVAIVLIGPPSLRLL
jgi:hypothetical protein